MVSLNYKNSVIKSILKEEFDKKQFNQQLREFEKLIEKIIADGVGGNAYILEEDGYTSIITPMSNIKIKNIANVSIQFCNAIKARYKMFYGNKKYRNGDNYYIYIPCQKLFYKIDNVLKFDIMPVAVQSFSTEKEKDMESIMSQKFNKSVKLGDDLYNFIGNQLKQFYATIGKSNQNDKDLTTNLSNINLDNISKELDVITKIDNQNYPEPPANDRGDFFSSAHGRTLMLDPQHLVRTEKYMDVMTIEQTVQENLRKIKNFEKDNPINYLAANVVFNTIEHVAKSDASHRVDIFDNEVKAELSQIKNYKKKSVSSVETLGGLENNTVGYSMIKNISTKPIEILSPMVLANMDSAIKWGHDGDMTSNQIIDKIFGRNNMKNAKISYPAAGEQFFDSFMAVPCDNGYKIMKVSTKGGIDGIGASATINSLYKMLIVFDGDARYPHSEILTNLARTNQITESNVIQCLESTQLKFTPYTKALVESYPLETAFLLIFGGTEPKNHLSIFHYLKNNKSFGIDYSNCLMLSDYIKASNSLDITGCVIKLLNYQKYDISQINCTPRIEDNKFWYDYEIQYPAHFSGRVALERRNTGVAFHILASK